jgi:two-component system, cell cycle sensor histidine kinase and response regulator CckA
MTAGLEVTSSRGMTRVYSIQHRAPSQFAADPALHDRDERLESLKAVIGKLAHDFNNFLVPLLGYVTLIREEVPEASTANQYAMTMESAARKTEGFIEAVLLGVRPHRRFNARDLDFGAVVDAAIEKFQNSLPPSAQIQIEKSTAPVELYADETQWHTALGHLLGNARFALATGGALKISLTREPISDEQGTALNIWPGEGVKLVISDNGFGMNEATRRRAFEPFFTTRTAAHASGLGLTVAHSVTQLHGGQIKLESKEDQGTTVTIWLPITKAPETTAPTQRPATPQKAPIREPRGKILLVEDDPLVREVVKSCLQKFRKDIYVAQDGEEGLRIFKRYSADWALVVSDITMPKMTGIELYRAIHEIDPEMRMILVSGDADGKYHDAFANEAMRPLLLKKPFTLKAFADIVREHVH